MIIEAILLGLSTGTYCTMYCGPVLIPFLFGTEENSQYKNLVLTGTFLGSRLFIYFILGIFFYSAGLLVSEFFDPYFARRLSVVAYIFSGVFLLLNSFGVRFPWGKSSCKCPKLKVIGNDFFTAVLTGFSVGLHICPALWTAIFRSFIPQNNSANIFYLVFFYIGTLPFYLPVLGIPFVKKRIAALKQIARISQFLIGIYFLVFAGLIPLVF